MYFYTWQLVGPVCRMKVGGRRHDGSVLKSHLLRHSAAALTPPDLPRGAADVALALLLSAHFSADPLQTQLHPTMWSLSLTCDTPASAQTNLLCYNGLSDFILELETKSIAQIFFIAIFSLAKDEKNKQTFVTGVLRWFFWKCVLSAGFIRKWQQDVSESSGAF